MIFCVEDDPNIRELEVYTLQSVGFKALGVGSGDELFKELGCTKPTLILLDIMLPGDDGITLLKRLRSDKRTAQVPVIMATAKGTEFDKVKGLDMGADDYLVKPFGMMEMVSRIKAVLRRTRDQARPRLVYFGELTLEPQRYTVYHQDEQIPLTLKEFDLLSLLMLHPDRVFTRQELLDKVWGTQFFGETRTVDVHIGTLRTKLGACGEYIKTVRGVGYRMEEPHD